jgi:hypothetical protein
MDASRPLSDNLSPGNSPEIDVALTLPSERYCPQHPGSTQEVKNRPVVAAQV